MEYKTNRIADYTSDVSTRRGRVDLPFLLLTLLLLTIGVIMVLSASFASAYYDLNHETKGVATYYFFRQSLFAALGVCAMLILSKLPISFYRRVSTLFMLFAIATLVAVPIIGTRANGAKRWISLGFTTFQPSELAKLAVILTFSDMICKYREKMATVRYGIIPFAAILAVIIGLLILEPHLSASIIILTVSAVLIFLGGAQLKWFVGGGVLALGAGVVLLTVFPYASSRVTTWLDPWSDLSDNGWQIVQSLYAIGSGGLSGLGLGQSRQKYLYLPEEHNDFIFSVVCEELGFIGAILILTLFALLIIRGYWLAMHAKDRYSLLVCAGITTLLALQVILNVAVCANVVPCTGISLPFFSYGGTALMLQLGEMGIILSISRDIPGKKLTRPGRSGRVPQSAAQ